VIANWSKQNRDKLALTDKNNVQHIVCTSMYVYLFYRLGYVFFFLNVVEIR